MSPGFGVFRTERRRCGTRVLFARSALLRAGQRRKEESFLRFYGTTEVISCYVSLRECGIEGQHGCVSGIASSSLRG